MYKERGLTQLYTQIFLPSRNTSVKQYTFCEIIAVTFSIKSPWVTYTSNSEFIFFIGVVTEDGYRERDGWEPSMETLRPTHTT